MRELDTDSKAAFDGAFSKVEDKQASSSSKGEDEPKTAEEKKAEAAAKREEKKRLKAEAEANKGPVSPIDAAVAAAKKAKAAVDAMVTKTKNTLTDARKHKYAVNATKTLNDLEDFNQNKLPGLKKPYVRIITLSAMSEPIPKDLLEEVRKASVDQEAMIEDLVFFLSFS